MLEKQGGLKHLIFLAGLEGLRRFQIAGSVLAEAWSRLGIPSAHQPSRGVCSLLLQLCAVYVACGALPRSVLSVLYSRARLLVPQSGEASLCCEVGPTLPRACLLPLYLPRLEMPFDAAKISTFSLNPALEQGSLFGGGEGVVKFGGTESPNPPARGLCDHGLCDRGQCDRGLCDRGLCDRGQCDRGQSDRGQCERGLCERGLCERGQCERGLCDCGQCDRGLCDREHIT